MTAERDPAADRVIAYHATRYIVDGLGTLRVGKANDHLARLLQAGGTQDWAFITAMNPFGQSLSEAENRRRMQALLQAVERYLVMTGRGEASGGGWVEESLFVLGIAPEEALELGRRFHQEAILAGPGDVPRLHWPFERAGHRHQPLL